MEIGDWHTCWGEVDGDGRNLKAIETCSSHKGRYWASSHDVWLQKAEDVLGRISKGSLAMLKKGWPEECDMIWLGAPSTYLVISNFVKNVANPQQWQRVIKGR
jgi:hypothetical protein